MLDGAFGQLCRTNTIEIAQLQIATLRISMLASLLHEAEQALTRDATACELPPADFDDTNLAPWQRHALMLLSAETVH